MAYDIGTARGVIEMQYNGRGVTEAQADIKGIQDNSARTGMSLDQMGNRAGVAGLAIAGGFALAVNTAANFEQRMSAIGAVSGASANELDSLREKALQLGKDTAFSAGESAVAMEELIKSGMTVEEVLNGAADATVALAAAGEVDMPTAASVASSAMNSFAIEASKMDHIADLFAGAANASATGVAELGESFKYVAPLASSAGVSIDDTVASLAAMADVGITGSQAGTTLRAMLTRLQPASAKAASAMKELGIITKDGQNQFFTASGEMKSMGDVSQILKESLSGLSDAERTRALSTIFGANAMAGATALAGKGKKGFDELNQTIQDTDAAKVAEARLDNFKGTLDAAMGSVETLGITIGSILLPALTTFVEKITAVLNAFLNLPSGVQKAIVGFTGLVGALLLAFAAFTKIMGAIKSFQAALLTLRTVLVGTTAAQNMGTIAAIRQRAAVIAQAVATKAAAAASAVMRGAVVAWTAVQWALNAALLANPIGLVIAVIVALVAAFIIAYKKSETFRNIVDGALRVVGDAFKWLWDQAKAVFEWLKSNWPTILAILTGPIGIAVLLITKNWNKIKGATRAAFNAIRGIIVAVWNAIKGAFRAALTFIVNFLQSRWNNLKSNTKAVFNAIRDIIKGAWDAVSGVVSGAVKKVLGFIKGAWDNARSATTDAFGRIVSAVGDKLGDVARKAGELPGKILGALAGLAGDMYNKGKEIIQNLIDGIGAMAGALAKKAGDVIKGGIGKLIPGSPVEEGPLTVLNRGHAGKQIVRMLIDGIEEMTPALNAAMSSVASPTPGALAVPLAGAAGAGGGALRMISGELDLSPDGRAFISGVAEDADADHDDYADTLARMGR